MQTTAFTGPNAEDYPPYYRRFLENPLGPHYFNWLPAHIFSPTDISAIQLLERPRDFFRYLNDYVPKFTKLRYTPIVQRIPNIFVEQKHRLIEKAIIALRLRAAFRRLVHLWIWRKVARAPLPDTDAITMAPFEQPVRITDMRRRRAYIFEAAPLIAHIESQLNYVNYGFVQPMQPRNPTTNLPFSSAQLIELYKQCVKYGRVNAAFAAFRECKYNVERYHTIYRHAIAFNYNMRTVMQPRNDAGRDILIEFIEECADLLLETLTDDDIQIFEYGMEHFHSHPYLKKWRRAFIARQFCDEDSLEDRVLYDSLMVRVKDLFTIRHVVLNEFRRAKFEAGDE
jgi:hypothetical protein